MGGAGMADMKLLIEALSVDRYLAYALRRLVGHLYRCSLTYILKIDF